MRAALFLQFAALSLSISPGSSWANDLVQAARAGDMKSVQMMLSRGADANGVNSYGESALGWASFNGQTPVVAELLAAGGDANRKDALGNSPVVYAAAKGHADILRLLIGQGADCNTRGRGEFTPLMAAARGGSLGRRRGPA